MNFGLDMNLNVGMEQRLSPQMIQSLKLLQMNAMELEMVVKQELETNPMLETLEDSEMETESTQEEGEESASSTESSSETDSAEAPEREEPVAPDEVELGQVADNTQNNQEVDWETYLEDGFDLGNKQSEELESPDERFEKVPVYSKTLQDHLFGQLQDRFVAPEVGRLVEYLINSLDERGYLIQERQPGPEEDEGLDDGEDAEVEAITLGISKIPEAPAVARRLGKASGTISPALDTDPKIQAIQAVLDGSLELDAAGPEVREAFHVLQGMDPAGIGARNLRECLLLQIYRYGRVSPLAQKIVEDAFDLLEKLKVSAIAKKFDAPPEDVQAAMKEIGNLEPHPGRLVSSTTANAVTPDLIVEEIDGELVLMLNDRSIPSLKISNAYSRLLKKGSRANADEKKFVRDKLNSATWLIRAIEQRKSTMLKVMQAIIESQPDFFKEGPTHLRPLILQDVADKIQMHISTVSRVTNGKYVQTKHGLFELKYFFTAGVTQSDGREVSSVATKDEIKKLIEAEDPRKPLSDQKIVETLKAKGLDVARRTVAKYRDQLEILPARLRKRY